jgi:hypothetical protein
MAMRQRTLASEFGRTVVVPGGSSITLELAGKPLGDRVEGLRAVDSALNSRRAGRAGLIGLLASRRQGGRRRRIRSRSSGPQNRESPAMRGSTAGLDHH